MLPKYLSKKGYILTAKAHNFKDLLIFFSKLKFKVVYQKQDFISLKIGAIIFV